MAFMFPLFLLEAWRVTGLEVAGPIPVTCTAWLFRRLAPFAAVAIAAPRSPTTWPASTSRPSSATPTSTCASRRRSRPTACSVPLSGPQPRRRADPAARAARHGPCVQISGHGLALWVTTPVSCCSGLASASADPPGPVDHRRRWSPPSLFYQNSGWLQFGYRFGLDYTAVPGPAARHRRPPLGWGVRDADRDRHRGEPVRRDHLRSRLASTTAPTARDAYDVVVGTSAGRSDGRALFATPPSCGLGDV